MRALELFVLSYLTNVINASITYGMVRFKYPMALTAEGLAWAMWLVTVKIVYSATEPLEYVAFIVGAILGLATTMRWHQRHP